MFLSPLLSHHFLPVERQRAKPNLQPLQLLLEPTWNRGCNQSIAAIFRGLLPHMAAHTQLSALRPILKQNHGKYGGKSLLRELRALGVQRLQRWWFNSKRRLWHCGVWHYYVVHRWEPSAFSLKAHPSGKPWKLRWQEFAARVECAAYVTLSCVELCWWCNLKRRLWHFVAWHCWGIVV